MKKVIFGLFVVPFMLGASVASADGFKITNSYVQPVPPTHIDVVYDKTNPDIMLISSNQNIQNVYRAAVNALITKFLQVIDWDSAEGDINFTATNYSINNGCNTIFGTYAINGTAINLSKPASTMMACEQDKMDADQELIKKLNVINSITFKDGKLVLSGGGAVLKFTPSFKSTSK